MRTSRARLIAIFARQKVALVRGMCPQRGQPCQKQPSTKTATFLRGKYRSGRPAISLTCNRNPRIPLRTRDMRILSSVVLLPLPRTDRIWRRRVSDTRPKPFEGNFARRSDRNWLLVTKSFRIPTSLLTVDVGLAHSSDFGSPLGGNREVRKSMHWVLHTPAACGALRDCCVRCAAERA